jgi:hypothetical protein
MNNAYREYQLNGWDIRASETYNDWEVQPVYETIEEWENFINNENVRFKRLAEAKKWVKTEEATELKNKYMNNKENEKMINNKLENELSSKAKISVKYLKEMLKDGDLQENQERKIFDMIELINEYEQNKIEEE